MILPEYRMDWPRRYVDDYAERVRIMLTEGVSDAERLAEIDVRKCAEREA